MMPVTSGIRHLDAALGGGFADGTLCAIVGDTGSGLGVLAKQFASVGDEKSYYFSTIDSRDEVLSTITRFGWRTDLEIVDIGEEFSGKDKDTAVFNNCRRFHSFRMSIIRSFSRA